MEGTLTFTAAADMDVSELLNLISQKAETIEPYATAAYTAAKNIAYRAYYNTKSAVLDSLWAAPYTKDALASLVPGYERKYDVNYGARLRGLHKLRPRAEHGAGRCGKSGRYSGKDAGSPTKRLTRSPPQWACPIRRRRRYRRAYGKRQDCRRTRQIFRRLFQKFNGGRTCRRKTEDERSNGKSTGRGRKNRRGDRGGI